MKVTGYQLRAAIKSREIQLKVAISLFEDSLMAFPGEDKNPVELMNDVAALEYDIAKLQEQQGLYNQAVTLEVQGESYSLAMAVKYDGGAGRAEKLWRSALPKKERYSYRQDSRKADEQFAKSTIEPKVLVGLVEKSATFAANLRGAIAAANNTEVEISGLTQEML